MLDGQAKNVCLGEIRSEHIFNKNNPTCGTIQSGSGTFAVKNEGVLPWQLMQIWLFNMGSW